MLLANLRIDKHPVTVINSLFSIVDYKTNIEGYWNYNDKLYIDNIEYVQYHAIETLAFLAHKKQLFSKGEKCVAYKDKYNQLVLEYPNGTWDILKNRIEIIEDVKPSTEYINLLLENCNGLTVYNIDSKYIIEIYK